MVAVLVLALVGAACSGGSPRIVVEPETLDLGEVPQEILEMTYTVRNLGDADLNIEKVSTSCGCTKAVLDRELIPPGETAELRVTFDTVEDDLRGDVVRFIYILSNDPNTREAAAELRATVRPAGS